MYIYIYMCIYIYIYIYIYINKSYIIHCKIKIKKDNLQVPKIVRVPVHKKEILRK